MLSENLSAEDTEMASQNGRGWKGPLLKQVPLEQVAKGCVQWVLSIFREESSRD